MNIIGSKRKLREKLKLPIGGDVVAIICACFGLTFVRGKNFGRREFGAFYTLAFEDGGIYSRDGFGRAELTFLPPDRFSLIRSLVSAFRPF